MKAIKVKISFEYTFPGTNESWARNLALSHDNKTGLFGGMNITTEKVTIDPNAEEWKTRLNPVKEETKAPETPKSNKSTGNYEQILNTWENVRNH